MDEIRRAASMVRNWCQEVRFQFRKTGYDNELTGMCAIASAKLFDTLEQLGYNPTIAVSDNDDASHVFVIVDDFIVDVTATQFGRNPIEIVHAKTATEWYWQIYYECDSIKSLVKHQKRNGWPSWQIASSDKVFYNDINIH